MKIIEIISNNADSISETRKGAFRYIKSLLPKWPDYVLRDWIYDIARGTHQRNPNFVPTDEEPFEWGFNKETIFSMIEREGLSPDTKWTFYPKFHFQFDKLHPDTQARLKSRDGGAKNPFQVPRDAERHAKQAELAKAQGGVRNEPVIGIMKSNGFDLIEGWHRTIQHFKMFPNGYEGPAWVAKSNIAEETNTDQKLEKQILIRIRQILYDRRLSNTKSNAGELHRLRQQLKDLRSKRNISEDPSVNKQWMTDSDLDMYVPERLQQEWRELLGYDEYGNVHPLWKSITDIDEPNSIFPAHRAWMVMVANAWFKINNIHGVKFYDVKDIDDELEWQVHIDQQTVNENFADGKGPGRPGDSRRHGIPKNATMAQLQKAAKSSGRKGQLARWQLNMRRGRKKSNESTLEEADNTVFIYERPVELLFNPGYQRMLAFAKQSEYAQVRALYIPSRDVVVVWKAELGIHHAIATALIDQLGWDLGPDYENRMMKRKLNDPMHPISAILTVSKPLVDKSGKPMRDTNLHRRAGDFSITAYPQFYKTDWWKRIERTAPQEPVNETWSKKYKRSINCSHPKGFSQKAHCAARRKRKAGGHTKSKPVREDLSAPQRTLATNLAKLSEHVNLVQMPTVNGGKSFIVDLDQRPVVVVKFGGHTVPFYCSTGQGGKANVAAGKWYPFWGIGSDGWFNKGTENMINSFYSSKTLAKTAAMLDQYLGNLIGTRGIPMAGTSAIAVINANQQPKAKMEAAADLIKYYARITDQVRKIS